MNIALGSTHTKNIKNKNTSKNRLTTIESSKKKGRVYPIQHLTFLGFTLEAKLVSSKHLIKVHLEILSRFVENMASHLLTKSITWSKSCQSRRSLESWNRWTCPSCPWLPFLIGQVCSQVWCRPYFGANFGFSELRIRTFPWSPGIVEVGTFYPLTFKVGSKYPNILRESSSLKLTIMVLVLSRK